MMLIKILIFIVIIETLYIWYLRKNDTGSQEITNIVTLFDKFIDLYGISFIQTRVALDIVSQNKILTEEEFVNLRTQYVEFIWDRLPIVLKKKLLKFFGERESINYILSRVDPVLNDTYRINNKMEVISDEELIRRALEEQS